jgi:hypothetical protein
MVLNLHLYVIDNNYKCDNPNNPFIHAFTPWQSSKSSKPWWKLIQEGRSRPFGVTMVVSSLLKLSRIITK